MNAVTLIPVTLIPYVGKEQRARPAISATARRVPGDDTIRADFARFNGKVAAMAHEWGVADVSARYHLQRLGLITKTPRQPKPEVAPVEVAPEPQVVARAEVLETVAEIAEEARTAVQAAVLTAVDEAFATALVAAVPRAWAWRTWS
jgi:hypothetical protein